MSKDNILYTIIGLLVGLIIGFIATNNYNRSAMVAPNLQTQNNPSQNPAQNQPHSQPGQNGAMPEVQETLDKADKEPNNFDAQIKAGEMFARIKNLDKAIPYFEKAAQLKPTDYQLLVILGNANFDVQKWEEAQKWYEKALAIKKDDIAVRTDLGITFVEREKPDFDRAIKEFQTSLEINPNHEQTIFNMALAYLKKGDSAKVQELKKKLVSNPELSKRLDEILNAK